MEPANPSCLLSGSLQNMFAGPSSKKIMTAASFSFLASLPPVRIVWAVFPSSLFLLGCIWLFIGKMRLGVVALLNYTAASMWTGQVEWSRKRAGQDFPQPSPSCCPGPELLTFSIFVM